MRTVVKDVATIILVVMVLLAGGAVAGFALGYNHHKQINMEPRCPLVEGKEVVTSSVTSEDTICVYAPVGRTGAKLKISLGAKNAS